MVYAVGLALERNPQVAEAIPRGGSDVVAHGWRWIDYALHSRGLRGTRAYPALHRGDSRGSPASARWAGTRGRPSPDTRRLVVEEGGFLYDGDADADDLPFWT